MDVEYIDEQPAQLTIDINYEQYMKPSKKPRVHKTEVMKPVLVPQTNQSREKPLAHCKLKASAQPMQLINRPIEKIYFATFEEYLTYKQLYG